MRKLSHVLFLAMFFMGGLSSSDCFCSASDVLLFVDSGLGIKTAKYFEECEDQYVRDSAVCRNLPTNGARGRCWESASERKQYCERNGGETGRPRLITR